MLHSYPSSLVCPILEQPVYFILFDHVLGKDDLMVATTYFTIIKIRHDNHTFIKVRRWQRSCKTICFIDIPQQNFNSIDSTEFLHNLLQRRAAKYQFMLSPSRITGYIFVKWLYGKSTSSLIKGTPLIRFHTDFLLRPVRTERNSPIKQTECNR